MKALAEEQVITVDLRESTNFSVDLLEKVLLLPNPDKSIMVHYFGLFNQPKKTIQQIGTEYCRSEQEIKTRIQLSLDRIRLT